MFITDIDFKLSHPLPASPVQVQEHKLSLQSKNVGYE